MKRISAKKQILVIMSIFTILFMVSSNVFATGTTNGPIGINILSGEDNPPTTTNETQTPTINAETEQPTQNAQTPIAPTNDTGSTYQNDTSLPKTGDASDYAIFMLIIVSIVIAIYAYKKVREYNIK